MAKKKETGTALTVWEEQFADLAKEDTKGVITSDGRFLSFKNGDLSFGGEEIPDNELEMVIVGWMYHNTYYDPDIKYDPKDPAPPLCYSFGREAEEMEPMDEAPDKQCGTCHGCPMNVFGSGIGNSKACKNNVRIALIASDDLDNIEESEVIYANIPPTSIKNWNAYIAKTLRDKHKRPCWSVVTLLSVTKESDSVFQVHFEIAEDGILKDPKLFAPLQQKYNDTMGKIVTPYPVKDVTVPVKGSRKPVAGRKSTAKPTPKKFSK